MKKVNSVTYTYLIGDLLHAGHLKLLEQARKAGDYHICGVITDTAAKKWNSPIICTYEERELVIKSLNCVDEVVCQDSMDPTDNLKEIHSRFPGCKIILFQGHQKWGQMPGVEFINKIGGEIVRPNYYPKLSRENIAKAFVAEAMKENTVVKGFSNRINIGNVNHFDSEFTSKADTLNNLQSSLKRSIIEPLFIFTVEQWEKEKNKITASIREKFGGFKIVVRSSAQNEDNFEFSNAGNFHSVLNVEPNNKEEISNAVDKVIGSYHLKNAISPGNQVLVQSQTQGVVLSGVILTRSTFLNKPYYVINYDDVSQDTDSVTSGMSCSKIEILRNASLSGIPERWRNLLCAVQEIENLLSGLILDIEFAINTKNEVIIFQVRPLAANSKFGFFNDDKVFERVAAFRSVFHEYQKNKNLLCKDIFLSDMAFWNPAEIIGDHPNYLDYSLYNNLILKSNWNEGLIPLGYSRVEDSLMVQIGSKPYINVHHAFLGLLPEDLPEGLKSRLLIFYNKKLRSNPEFHDKIEFEIVHNCFDFMLDQSIEELAKEGFAEVDILLLKRSLFKLTNNIMVNYKNIIETDLKDIKALEQKRHRSIEEFNKNKNWQTSLYCVGELLEDCKKYGTSQFSRIARLAFIGKRILNSLKELEIMDQSEYNLFLSGIPTVASEMDKAFSKLRKEKNILDSFLSQYGHLRPSTYDINRLPYNKNKDYFKFSLEETVVQTPVTEFLSPSRIVELEKRITKVSLQHKLSANGKELLEFVRISTQMREFFKFEFTKNLSEALELIAYAGSELGFERSDLSNLDYHSVAILSKTMNREELLNMWKAQMFARTKEREINSHISLPSLLFSENDFMTVQSYTSKPNFVTTQNVEGEVCTLDSYQSEKFPDFTDKIIVLEKADPGYDWIFTNKIMGLITKYGGVASHMAIRCAEFNIPAAIGCGEIIYARAAKSHRILLDCKNRKIDIL